MAALLQIAGAISQRNAAKNQAYVQQKTAKTDSLTEEYNSEIRKGERIKKYKEQAAQNRAVGASSGASTATGSPALINQTSVGNLKTANYLDVFSTKIKSGQIKEAAAVRGRAIRARANASLLNTVGSIYQQTASKL